MSPLRNSIAAGCAALALLVVSVHVAAQATTPPVTQGPQTGQSQAPPPAQPPQTTATPPQTTATAPPQAAAAAPAAPQAEPPTGKSVIVQRILVKVNGEPFTQTDLEALQTDVLQSMNIEAPAKSAKDDAALRAQLVKITPTIITKAVDDLLLIQRAKELGYKMTEDQYQKILDDIKKDNKMDDAQFKQAMKEEGLTPERLHENMEHDYLKRAVVQSEVMKNTIMTDLEAKQYYADHQSDFMRPAKVTLREIMITVPTQTIGGQTSFNAAADEAARDKANAVHDRLVKGEDFAKVAAEVSDSPSKANGGLLGDVNLQDMNTNIRPTIEAMKPGDVTDPIRTRTGYQILKLDSRAAAEPKPYDEVKEEIFNKMYAARVDVETQKYLDKVRASALIEWKDANLKKMYDDQMAANAASTKKPGGE